VSYHNGVEHGAGRPHDRPELIPADLGGPVLEESAVRVHVGQARHHRRLGPFLHPKGPGRMRPGLVVVLLRGGHSVATLLLILLVHLFFPIPGGIVVVV
jgi:hypothetical protein